MNFSASTPSNLDSSFLKNSYGFSPTLEKDPFISSISALENLQPNVANAIRRAYEDNSTKLTLKDARITELPPLPPLISELEIIGCHYLTTLVVVSPLIKLTISRCMDVISLRNDSSHLTELHIEVCSGFTALTGDFPLLAKLTIDNCWQFEALPDNLVQLAELRISECGHFKKLPELPLLTSLTLTDNYFLEVFSFDLPQLIRLTISNFNSLTTLSGDLRQLANLTLKNCPRLVVVPENLPLDLNLSAEHCNDELLLFFGQVRRKVQDQLQAQIRSTSLEDSGTRLNLVSTTVPQSYKQKYRRSCGAASLFFIARELSIKQNPLLAQIVSKFPLLEGSFARCDATLSVEFFNEKDVYIVTSAFKGNIRDIEHARGSLPQNIIRAAELVGLEAELYVPANAYTEIMRNDPTMPEIKNGFFEKALSINTNTAPPLKEGELEMKLLTFVDSFGARILGDWDSVSHWVVCRSDGSFMDPGLGENFDNFEELNTQYNCNKVVAIDSGITIQLTEKKSYLEVDSKPEGCVLF